MNQSAGDKPGGYEVPWSDADKRWRKSMQQRIPSIYANPFRDRASI